MAELPQLSIDAPIAGQSLTTEPGNRPWENPPQYTTVEEALEYYIHKLEEDNCTPASIYTFNTLLKWIELEHYKNEN